MNTPAPSPGDGDRVKDQLDLRGDRRDTKEIARRFEFCDEHVRRILRIGYLAPDIVDGNIEGRQPRSMAVKRLLQGVPCIGLTSASHSGLLVNFDQHADLSMSSG
jgi:hypothetical protein